MIDGVRAGAFALSLLSAPLNVQVLQALEEEPMPLFDLRRQVGSPPQTTMRVHLKGLTEAGILERRQQRQFPGPVEYELTKPGAALLEAAEVLRLWLEQSPEGPLELGTQAAKSALKALLEGWSAGVVRALAARPLALTELSRLISGLSYPSLERRLGSLRSTGQIARCPGSGRGTPYTVTDWLRRAVAPLLAAARWERRYEAEQAPVFKRIDAESSLLLPMPLVAVPDHLNGTCRLAVELGSSGAERKIAGVMVGVREGRIVSCVSRLEGEASAWCAGSVPAWFDSLLDHDMAKLETGGDGELAAALVGGLHASLRSVAASVPGRA